MSRLKTHGHEAKWTLPKHGVHFRSAGVSTSGKVAALFSGQGSQYTQMFEDAAMNWPQVRTAISEMDAASVEARPAGTPLVSETLFPREAYGSETKPDHDKVMQDTLHAQPCTTAVSVGAYDVLAAAGCKADFTAGHSLGELAALYAGGVLDRTKACDLVCHRATAMAASAKEAKGQAMAAVIGPGASDLVVSGANVWLANINEPSQVVISGAESAVASESAKLSAAGFRVVPLKVSGAFHTPLMKSASSVFEARVRDATSAFKPATAKVYSNVTGSAAYNGSAAESVALLSKHMVSSVKWVEQVRAMHRDGARVFVEFGPRSTLTKFVEKILPAAADTIVVSVNGSKDKSSDLQLREAAIQLAVFGVPITNFDPWGVPNAYKLGANPEVPPPKKSKGMLKLSAATFVAPRTHRALEAAMTDGYKLSGNVVASSGPSSGEMQAKTREIAKLKQEADESKKAAESLAKKLKAAEAALDAARADAETAKSQAAVAAARPLPAAPPPPAAAAAPASGVSAQDATDCVLSVLAAKTGYEPDMIEMDMNLETELGVDSIKRVEILSEVQKQLNVEAQNVAALSRTQTVGEVVEAMIKELGAVAGSAPPAAAVAKSVAGAVDTACDDAIAAATDVTLTFAATEEIALPAQLSLKFSPSRPVLLVDDGSALTAEIAKELLSKPGCSVVVLSFSKAPAVALPSAATRVFVADRSEAALEKAVNDITPCGLIYQHSGTDAADEHTQLRWAILAAKHVSPHLESFKATGRPFFVGLASMGNDGKLGLVNPSSGAFDSTPGLPDVLRAQRGAIFGEPASSLSAPRVSADHPAARPAARPAAHPPRYAPSPHPIPHTVARLGCEPLGATTAPRCL